MAWLGVKRSAIRGAVDGGRAPAALTAYTAPAFPPVAATNQGPSS